MAGPTGDDRVNMVPLIDCMFFLILFFMIVTKFTPDELAIASLLPTDKGQMSAPSKSPLPKEQVNIAIYPAGLQKGMQPSEYQAQVEAMWNDHTFDAKAWLRIGGSNPAEIDGKPLATRGAKAESALMREQVALFHSYVFKELDSREQAGKPRSEQAPVVISCYSGLSWKYAILAYDAVRAFEATKTQGYNKTLFDLEKAREVTFAPPRIRNYNRRELGNELYEIIHLR